MIDLSKLTTETENPVSKNLSAMTITDSIELFNKEDYKAVSCIESQYSNIEKVIKLTIKALESNGRIIYIGAGTSGRLGVLDAVECPPTFGVDYDRVIGLVAGGESAFGIPKEDIEDSAEIIVEDLKNVNLNSNDIVIGIAASGRTPYVISGLEYAKKIGSSYAAIVCNFDSDISKICENTIEIVPGPELLTGSTRLKSGTATKLVLNMISTIAMTQIGKVYKNYMVDVQLSNKKLVQRGINIICAVTECSNQLAEEKLNEADNSVKTAIVMILYNLDYEDAKLSLIKSFGKIENIEN
jgi:N-acetylmuramic acid 6-phosphate etherase